MRVPIVTVEDMKFVAEPVKLCDRLSLFVVKVVLVTNLPLDCVSLANEVLNIMYTIH